MTNPRHVIVLGGGISGLTTAIALRTQLPSTSVTLLEASHRFGGWLHSHRLPDQEGMLFEKGCRSIRPRGANQTPLLKLIELLELKHDVLPATPQGAQKRYIYYDGQLNKIPETPVELMKWPLIRKKFRSFLREGIQPKSTTEDESVDSFFRRRLGDDIADRMVNPMINGIYAGDSTKLSIRSVFPSLYKMEQEYGSMMKAMLLGKMQLDTSHANLKIEDEDVKALSQQSSISFRDGVSQLADKAAEILQKDDNVSLHSETHCTAIYQQNGHSSREVTVETTNTDGKSSGHATPRTFKADYVVSCLPSQTLADVLPPALSRAADNLRDIPRSSVASVNLGWKPSQGDVLKGKRGFGYLVPTSQWENGGPDRDHSSEGSPSDVIPGVLGMTWDSCVFPAQGTNLPATSPFDASAHGTRLTAMIGGARFPDIEHMDTEEIELLALLATKEQMDIAEEPDIVHVNVALNAIPQYTLGHEEKLDAIREEVQLLLPRLYLAGNSYDGVGVADCVSSAFRTVDEISQ